MGRWHEALATQVDAGRLAHCERTSALCRAVAVAHPQWGIDPDRAALAGLVHDWGRGEGGGPALLDAALQYGIEVSEAARRSPVALLHAPVGARRLREAGLADEGILAAVAYHTVGRAGMDRLALLVYTADFCEPGRTHAGAAAVRDLLSDDLVSAARLATRCTVGHLLKRGSPVEAGAIALWNDLVTRGDASV